MLKWEILLSQSGESCYAGMVNIVMLEQDILLCWSGRFCYAEVGDFVMLEQDILLFMLEWEIL